MAVPNAQNPTFPGLVTAAGFNNLTGSGTCITAINADGLTRSYIFNANGNGFSGEITGIFLISKAATSCTCTVSNEDGTIASITTSATAGTFVGATSLSNVTIDREGTTSVILSGAPAVDGEALVFITYAVDN